MRSLINRVRDSIDNEMFRVNPYIKEGTGSLMSREDSIDDIHDRIINLRFERVFEPPIVIRSDYEPVFHKDGSITFIRCVEKPDIKIKYQHVADATSIKIEIEVRNFFIGDRELVGQSLTTARGNPLHSCTIQIGYRNHFHDWSRNRNIGNSDLDDYYNLTDNRTNARQITAQILTAYFKEYPPDNVLHFEGIVGTVRHGLRWNVGLNNVIPGFGDSSYPRDLSEIEQVFYQFVTRRFIRSGIPSNEVEDRVYVKEDRPMRLGEWRELILTDGLMSHTDAENFGVICIVSERLREYALSGTYPSGVTREQAEARGLQTQSLFNLQMDSLAGQMQAIRNHYPFIAWNLFPDGNFFVWHRDETDVDLWSDAAIRRLQSQDVKLPAIYDMTPEGTRVIRCPFISFLRPMLKVMWESRHDIGTFTSFFYNVRTNRFLVVLMQIDFATVQDINTVELTCVDQPPGILPEPNNIDTVSREAALRQQQRRNRKWIEVPRTVVTFRNHNANEIFSNVRSIINNHMVAAEEDFPNGLPTDKEKIETLAAWQNEKTPGIWDEWLAVRDGEHGVSVENLPGGIGAETGVDIPWLLPGYIVWVRDPYLPEYPPENQGTWRQV